MWHDPHWMGFCPYDFIKRDPGSLELPHQDRQKRKEAPQSLSHYKWSNSGMSVLCDHLVLHHFLLTEAEIKCQNLSGDEISEKVHFRNIGYYLGFFFHFNKSKGPFSLKLSMINHTIKVNMIKSE